MFVKIWIYSCPHLFIFTFYPIEWYSFVFALLTLPTIAFHWVTEPLYGLIINGDDIAEADIPPVSIGFAVACGLTSLSIIYTYVVGRKLIKRNGEMTDISNDKTLESSLWKPAKKIKVQFEGSIFVRQISKLGQTSTQ